MRISVIIPAYNEEERIVHTIESVFSRDSGCVEEVIVVDGGSTDCTVDEVQSTGAKIFSLPQKGRAVQMNYGAQNSNAEILYFLHADTIPPENFDKKIIEAVSKGNEAGCFRLSFDRHHFLLNFYARCTRFNIDAFRFGDQSLFIKKELFDSIGGFREDHIVMEDQEMVKRIKKEASFNILTDEVITSSRKYLENGVLKLQLIFTLIFSLYKVGVSQSKLVLIYKKLIH